MVLEHYQTAYEKWETETRHEGFKEGSLTTLHTVLVALYTARFGAIPEALQARILALQDLNTLQHLATVVGVGTPETIAEALQAAA